MTNKVRKYLLDDGEVETKCPKCGVNAWIIDGDPINKRAWLLCLDVYQRGCVETLPLPNNIIIENFEEET